MVERRYSVWKWGREATLMGFSKAEAVKFFSASHCWIQASHFTKEPFQMPRSSHNVCAHVFLCHGMIQYSDTMVDTWCQEPQQLKKEFILSSRWPGRTPKATCVLWRWLSEVHSFRLGCFLCSFIPQLNVRCLPSVSFHHYHHQSLPGALYQIRWHHIQEQLLITKGYSDEAAYQK